MDLVDLHIHGAFGIDVLTAGEAQLDTLSRGLAARGVAAFLPTLVPAGFPALAETLSRLSPWVRGRAEGDGRGALPLGIHFEGPFVSPGHRGALRGEHLRGGDALDAFLDAAGDVPGRPMMTLAPEVPGALEAARRLSRKGWLVAIGHTGADAATLDAARAAGARHMTHFGNAMRPLHQRESGPIEWGLTTDGVTLDVIGDLVHLSAGMLRLVFAAKGAGRVALVSDAVPPAGLPDGAFDVWGERLVLEGGLVRNAAGSLAGSACLLPEAVARLAHAGFEAEAMHRAASAVPRKILLS